MHRIRRFAICGVVKLHKGAFSGRTVKPIRPDQFESRPFRYSCLCAKWIGLTSRNLATGVVAQHFGYNPGLLAFAAAGFAHCRRSSPQRGHVGGRATVAPGRRSAAIGGQVRGWRTLDVYTSVRVAIYSVSCCCFRRSISRRCCSISRC